MEVEGRDVAGRHGIGLLELFLDLVGVEEGESGKDALEEFGGERPRLFRTDLLEEPPHRVGRGVDGDRVGGGIPVVVVRVDEVVARVAPCLFFGGCFAAELAEGVHSAEECASSDEAEAAESAKA